MTKTKKLHAKVFQGHSEKNFLSSSLRFWHRVINGL